MNIAEIENELRGHVGISVHVTSDGRLRFEGGGKTMFVLSKEAVIQLARLIDVKVRLVERVQAE